ncbi:hypothetical protein LOTGIDRAFT_201138 [Lottia gigantea]|uniref:Acylamino-acid-releasing enzyme n=1 Tax=Lottia gigantea TaxID=225164 RepID=V4A709_LOTGI|nr:hypothetical protein LOTGIDRAFT_201138 [Lottia gigantea]ESO99718.1 hypothetical protein LOTGIDRAFT_201138 [Lottia gigantea]
MPLLAVYTELKKVEEIVGVYRDLASISLPTSAQVRSVDDQFLAVTTQWSQRDLEKSEKTNFTVNYILNAQDYSVLIKTPSQEVKNEIWKKESPSGKYHAVVTSWKNKKGEEKQFIEIWNSQGKIKNYDVCSQEKHGKVNNKDDTFGCLQWSNNEEKLLYTSERKLPKTKSFFGTTNGNDDKKEEKDIVLGKEHYTVEDWGEQLVKKSCSVICILDIKSGTIEVLDTPADLSCGQACWGPEDNTVVFTGWNNDPFRLGLKYCTQRQSAVYTYDLKTQKITSISDKTQSSRSPNISPDQSKLVYFDQPIGGAHKQCSRLKMYDFKTQTNQVILDIVHRPKDEVCNGIYEDVLMSRCWSHDSKQIILSTSYRSRTVLYCINVETKTVRQLNGGIKDGSSSIVDIYKDIIIISCTSPNTPQHLMVGKLLSNPGEEIKWHYLNQPEIDNNISFHLSSHQPTTDRKHSKYGYLDYETILVLPKTTDDKKPPLILFPHGGPHTTFDTLYMMYVAGFCKCGFAVLMVNYRGSLGFGQDSVESILGNIGDQDVKDCKAAADEIISKGLVDGQKVFMFGGSHGGFLTTHLIGQYPDFFQAGCCRNPVTNLTVMTGVTDIPDWVYVESGFDYNHSCLLNPSYSEEMWKRSPIRYVDQVKAPLLLMIGKDDLRVPPSQAKEYYRALKTRNIKTRLIEYEDNCHPIVKVDSEADAFVNIMLWYKEHS